MNLLILYVLNLYECYELLMNRENIQYISIYNFMMHNFNLLVREVLREHICI